MANNIHYTGLIPSDCDWLKFKPMTGIIVENDGHYMETSTSIPTIIEFNMSPNNSNVPRNAYITFTLVNGASKTIKIAQKANQAGRYPSGNPIYTSSGSSLYVTNSESGVSADGGEINFEANFISAITQNFEDRDCDGNVTSRTSSSSTISGNVTNETECTWNVIKGMGYSGITSDNLHVSNGKLIIPANNLAMERIFAVSATYNNFTVYSNDIIQQPANIVWTFIIGAKYPENSKESDFETYAHFSGESGVTDIKMSSATEFDSDIEMSGNSSTYYGIYKISATTSPQIYAYITTKEFVKHVFTLISGDTSGNTFSYTTDYQSGNTSINVKSYDYSIIYKPENGNGYSGSTTSTLNAVDLTNTEKNIIIELKEYDQSSEIENEIKNGNDNS